MTRRWPALEAGEHEVRADDLAVTVKAALAGSIEDLYGLSRSN